MLVYFILHSTTGVIKFWGPHDSGDHMISGLPSAHDKLWKSLALAMDGLVSMVCLTVLRAVPRQLRQS